MKMCSLFSGSSGNCIYIGNEKTNILVDAGVSGSKITSSLNDICINPYIIDGILITHEHSDHIKGAGVFSRKYNIPIYATTKTWEAMEEKIGQLPLKNIIQIESTNDFYINDIDITPFSIPHDAIDPVGYCFNHKGKKSGICTDLGFMPKEVFTHIKDCDVLLLECNHDLDMLNNGSYPYALKRRISGRYGHLSNETCANVLCKIADRVKYVMLGHLSHENNTEDRARETVFRILEEKGIDCLNIEILKREYRSFLYDIL